jgi:hypothetical protein
MVMEYEYSVIVTLREEDGTAEEDGAGARAEEPLYGTMAFAAEDGRDADGRRDEDGC